MTAAGLPSSGWLRLARAAIFAAAGTALGVTAHRLGGGTAPPLWVEAAAAATLFGIAYALAGRERGRGVIAGLVLITQTAMHLSFAASGMHAMGGSSRTSLLGLILCRRAGHRLTARQIAAATATLRRLHVGPQAVAVHSTGMFTASMGTMLATHLVAAAVMAWWLARGERRAWRRAHRVVETIRAVVQGWAVSVPAVAGAIRPTVRVLRSCCIATCAAGRAPPTRRVSRALLPA